MKLVSIPNIAQSNVHMAEAIEVSNWCDEHFELGTWGKMIGFSGTSATYCFKHENDALLFLLRFPDK